MTAQLYLHEQVEGGLVTLRPTGELDVSTAAQLEEAVTRLCDEQRRQVILDLSRVIFLDAVGLRAVRKCRELFAEHDCGCWLLGANARSLRVAGEYERVRELPSWEDADTLAPRGRRQAQQPLRHRLVGARTTIPAA
jgi:anti-sigma B factor antagonist